MRVSLKGGRSNACNLAHIIGVDLDPEEEKAIKTEMKEKFKPLLNWFKAQTQDIVRDGSYCVVFSFFRTSDISVQ